MLLLRERNLSTEYETSDDQTSLVRCDFWWRDHGECLVLQEEGIGGRDDTVNRCKGLLLYLGAKDPSSGKVLPPKYEVVSPSWPEIRGLLQSRNKLAIYNKRTLTEVRHTLILLL